MFKWAFFFPLRFTAALNFLNIFCFAGRGVRPVFLEHNKLFFNFSKPLLVRTLSSPALLSPGPCDICFDPDSWQAPAMVFVRLLVSPSRRVDVTLSRKAKVPFSPSVQRFVVVVLRGNFVSAGKVKRYSGQPGGKRILISFNIPGHQNDLGY